MDSSTNIYAVLILSCLYGLYRRFYRSRDDLDDVQGPQPQSFWLGNLGQFFQREAGETDFELQDRFGRVACLNATLGGKILWLADPKAMQYIYQPSGYKFQKLPERRAMSRLHSGHGLVWADGDVHKRQRRVMLPAFGAPESKALFPLFVRSAQAVCSKWKELLGEDTKHAASVDVIPWLSRAMMDSIGEAAFDYHIGALDGNSSDFVRGYNDLMPILFGLQSEKSIFIVDNSRFIPAWFIEWLQDHMDSVALQKARECEASTLKIARELVDTKAEELAQGRGSRDVFSLIVKANASENEKSKLSEEEMYAEMRTILFAGHETTSNTVSFTLLELARAPALQTRLRQEVLEAKSAAQARGQAELSITDLENMPFAQAVVKEALRMHPVLPHNFRQAMKDDVIPLSTPITTKSGRVLTELYVTKGTRILLSVAAYNRDAEVWGSNPHTFDPDRWLDGRVGSSQSVGMYSNLLTFAGGVRSCIGWRFAIYQIQAFVTELVSQFEFAPTEDTHRVRRQLCGGMSLTLEGDRRHSTLPLTLSMVDRDAYC